MREHEKRIYWAVVSQRLRNTGLDHLDCLTLNDEGSMTIL